MPPVRVMGHLLPSRMPTSEAITCRAIAVPLRNSADACCANSYNRTLRPLEPFVQTAERSRSSWWQIRSLTVREDDDDPNRQASGSNAHAALAGSPPGSLPSDDATAPQQQGEEDSRQYGHDDGPEAP